MGEKSEETDAERAIRDVSSRVRQLRKEQGLTQEELAFEADVSRGFLSRLETEGRNISVVKLYQLADALSVPPRELLRSTDEEN